MLSFFAALRPTQWLKNLVLFAALVFNGHLFSEFILIKVFFGFISFCLLSSASYLINDLKDLPYDILGRELFFWFTRFLYRQGGVGHIIAEARVHSDHAVLQTFLDSQEKYRFMKSSPEFKLTQNFKKRVTSISFTKKNGLRGNLEMVDLISYFSYQFLEKNLKKFTRIGGRIIWRCIKEEMEKQKIQRIKTNGFKKLVPYVKARNLANYINQLSTKSRKSIN